MNRRLMLRAQRSGRIPARRNTAIPAGQVNLYWLGQAGFLVETRRLRILIDPYLSDVLAVKYAGKRYPHIRMAPPPIEAGELFDIDLMLSTHGHTDHLDPGTIPLVAEQNPACRFVVPAACRETAVSRGVPPERLLSAEAGTTVDGVSGCTVTPIPSAHEELSVNEAGEHLYLGYIIEIEGTVLYHSGDCVPYDGLVRNLRPFMVDLALLPVNGRDAERAAGGIPGNFMLEEAVALVQAVPVRYGIGHHFGLFDFNTLDEESARRYLAEHSPETAGRFLLVESGVHYELLPEDREIDRMVRYV